MRAPGSLPTPVGAPSRAGSVAIVITALAGLSGCSRESDASAKAATEAYQRQLTACRERLLKDPLVPIIGGGRLDTRRFAFNVPAVRVTNGECGTDGFETSFWWTGEKILPADQRFTGVPLTQIPKEWQLIHVGARLGNQRRCQENPEKCKSAVPAPPIEWPEHLRVRLRHYPLEVRMAESTPRYSTSEIGFVLTGWPREDGAPRFVNCYIRRDTAKMTRDEIESLNLAGQRFPCHADFFDFTFKGGAARVRLDTQILPTITPALLALHTYISDSINLEP